MNPNIQRSPALLGALLMLGLGAGCGGASSAYVPSSQTARESLQAALTAWQNGQRPGAVEGTSPPVQVVDSAWRDGQKLASFEILDEQPGEGAQDFLVRLTLKEPSATKDVHYFVHGREPVWVFRDEDYQRMVNMDNNPQLQKKPQRRSRTR
jgi:hypothetical protein